MHLIVESETFVNYNLRGYRNFPEYFEKMKMPSQNKKANSKVSQ